jgi:hypothetical protein
MSELPHPIYIIDGKRVDPDASEMNAVQDGSWYPHLVHEDVYEFQWLEPEDAVARFGEEARGGARIFTMWDYARRNGLVPPPMGPDDFDIGRLLELPSGATVRILRVGMSVMRKPTVRDAPPSKPAGLTVRVNGGSSMSIHISTRTAASQTEDLKAESIEVLQFLAEHAEFSKVRRATVIVCRNVPCAESRGGIEESFTFVRNESGWDYEQPIPAW